MSSNAKRAPIKLPFSLSKLDLIRRIKRNKIVVFKDVIVKKDKDEKGFNSI